MGQKIASTDFTAEDYILFRQKLVAQLKQLKQLTQQTSFGQGELKIGAELELYLIDKAGKTSSSNQLVLDKLNDPNFQFEINQYNLELNLPPLKVEDKALSKLHQQLDVKLTQLKKVTDELDIGFAQVGILPSLAAHDLSISKITNQARYHLLVEQLKKSRGEAFKINIHGVDELVTEFNHATAEGANTSFQLHLMTPPEQFGRIYNAILLSQCLVTAVAANSPILLGKKLWQETRIAMLKQVLDCRIKDYMQCQLPPRVNFGCGWLKQGAWDLYAEAVSVYPVLLPYLFEAESNSQDLPELKELNLHIGTVWGWNRPVYCPKNHGHIRIEFRALPAGPTNIDMVANAAFAIGIAIGLSEEIDELTAITPFYLANYNFYRAAQFGLNANILWPNLNDFQLRSESISDVVLAMLPIAKKGLVKYGFGLEDAENYLNIIQQRVINKQTGASWQIQQIQQLEQEHDTKTATSLMFESYIKQSQLDLPVATWSLS